jgi:hypothetical protein
MAFWRSRRYLDQKLLVLFRAYYKGLLIF